MLFDKVKKWLDVLLFKAFNGKLTEIVLSPGDDKSLCDVYDSVQDAWFLNRYIIKINTGKFVEPIIHMKDNIRLEFTSVEFVNIKGNGWMIQ